MRQILRLAIMSVFLPAQALADNDGVTRLDFNNQALPGIHVDIAPDSVDRDELAVEVKDELDGLRDDTDTNTTDIATNTTNIIANTTKLGLHNTAIASNTTKNIQQDTRLGSLETVQLDHSSVLNSHSALLSQHAATLGQHSKGLAIAMAMPDAWLMPTENFALSGNIGGFDDEMALGIAAIVRFDENWSGNAKVGSDLDFEEFGWTVGARVGF